MSGPALTLRSARTLIAALLALDVLVLIAFSVSKHTTTRTTSTPQAPLAAAPVAAAPVSGTPLANPPAVPVAPVAVAATVPNDNAHSSGSAPPAKAPSPPTSTPPEPGSVQLAVCPITITKATPPAGGLQSLISLAPAFGAFSAEAFASAAAYQPLLQLLGPILAQYPAMAPRLAPLVNQLVGALQRGSNALYVLIGPLYSPYRKQILQAETKLAARLAPLSAKLAQSPLGGCLVQLETALVHDTQRAALTR